METTVGAVRINQADQNNLRNNGQINAANREQPQAAELNANAFFPPSVFVGVGVGLAADVFRLTIETSRQYDSSWVYIPGSIFFGGCLYMAAQTLKGIYHDINQGQRENALQVKDIAPVVVGLLVGYALNKAFW